MKRWLLPILFLSVAASARHLESRTGFGLTLHSFQQIPALSMHYHMTDYQSAVVLAGVNTDPDEKSFVMGGKYYQNAHLEENLNFYVGIGGFLISSKSGQPSSATGFEIDGLFGAEFFFAGLPNLGIQFETGVGVRTLRQVSIATIGSGFLGGAIHYYF
jgi:hypothetical protein